MATTEGPHVEFTFEPIEATFPTLDSRDTKQLFIKWDLNRVQVMKFRFLQPFSRVLGDEFVRSFFNDRSVQASIMFVDPKGNPCRPSGTVTTVRYEELACSQTSMKFFDRLYDRGIVRREDQYIPKCMDRYLDGGVTVADKLRESFLVLHDDDDGGDGDEGGEGGQQHQHQHQQRHHVFTAKERSEFLYHLMWRLVAGGAMCQWEDSFTLYRETCRGIYKDLVRVQRNPHTEEVEPVSVVLSVKRVEGGTGATVPPLFGREAAANHNCCYLIIDPVKREVVYFYSGFVSLF